MITPEPFVEKDYLTFYRKGLLTLDLGYYETCFIKYTTERDLNLLHINLDIYSINLKKYYEVFIKMTIPFSLINEQKETLKSIE